MSALFSTLSQAWFKDSQQQYSSFNGLCVCAVDGVVWSMPHTEENFKHFGSSKGKTATAPYPQVRATCLVNTNTHEMIDAQMGSMDQGELTLASQLKAPVRSITLFDRAYFSAEHAKVSPLRISFHIASMSIINILRHTPLESAGNLPKHLAQLFEQSKIFVLPEKRQRQCPRVVKIKAQKYPRKCQSIS